MAGAAAREMIAEAPVIVIGDSIAGNPFPPSSPARLLIEVNAYSQPSLSSIISGVVSSFARLIADINAVALQGMGPSTAVSATSAGAQADRIIMGNKCKRNFIDLDIYFVV